MIKHEVKTKQYKGRMPYWGAKCTCGWEVATPTEQKTSRQVDFHISRDHRNTPKVTRSTQEAML